MKTDISSYALSHRLAAIEAFIMDHQAPVPIETRAFWRLMGSLSVAIRSGTKKERRHVNFVLSELELDLAIFENAKLPTMPPPIDHDEPRT